MVKSLTGESPHAECEEFKHLPRPRIVSEDPCRFSASLVHPASEILLSPANTHKGQYARANLSVDSIYIWSNLSPGSHHMQSVKIQTLTQTEMSQRRPLQVLSQTGASGIRNLVGPCKHTQRTVCKGKPVSG